MLSGYMPKTNSAWSKAFAAVKAIIAVSAVFWLVSCFALMKWDGKQHGLTDTYLGWINGLPNLVLFWSIVAAFMVVLATWIVRKYK